MSWAVGEVESKTYFIESKIKVRGKKQDGGTFPVKIHRLPLIYKCENGQEDQWVIGFHRGKFSLRYLDSCVDKDPWGFFRPNGQRTIENKDTGMDGRTLVRKLREKFNDEFVLHVINKLKAVE